MKYTIGLDFGTSSGRAVLVNTCSGAVCAEAESSYKHGVMTEELPGGKKLNEGWALQHPEDYLEVMDCIVSKAAAGINPSDIIGMAVDFTSCTILPVDNQKVPLCMKEKYRSHPHAYAKLWKHHSAQNETSMINDCIKKHPDLFQSTLGASISSELMLPKILQIYYEDKEIYDEAYAILEAGDWLAQVLTGENSRSLNMAAYKGMWAKTEYLTDKIMELSGQGPKHLSKDKLSSDIKPPGEKLGTLHPHWAKKWGLSETTAIGMSIIDSHAGIPSCGITKKGQMMLTIGTSSVQIVLEDTPLNQEGIYGTVKNGILPGFYAWESGIAAVGDLLDWYVGNHKIAIDSEILTAQEGHKELSAKAANLIPGESGLLALDWWNGNKTPYLSSTRRGAVIGLTLNTKPEEIYRALIESTAFGTRRIMETYEKYGCKIKEVLVCGGIPQKNPLVAQIYADILNKPLTVLKSSQVTAIGSAIYAAAAAGVKAGGYSTLTDAITHMSIQNKTICHPNKTHTEPYNKLYQNYLSLSNLFKPSTQDLMHQLTPHPKKKI